MIGALARAVDPQGLAPEAKLCLGQLLELMFFMSFGFFSLWDCMGHIAVSDNLGRVQRSYFATTSDVALGSPL